MVLEWVKPLNVLSKLDHFVHFFLERKKNAKFLLGESQLCIRVHPSGLLQGLPS